MLTELGHDSSVVGVARLYARFAATLVIDEADAGLAGEVEAAGLRCVVAPTIMSGPAEAAALARTVIDRRRAEGAGMTGISLIPSTGSRRSARATSWPT